MSVASPEYVAVIACIPSAKLVAVNCADPAANATAPICDCASRNDIVPVGVPEPDSGTTLAVNVPLPPAVICAAEAESEVKVLIFGGPETATEIAGETEVAKVESPE